MNRIPTNFRAISAFRGIDGRPCIFRSASLGQLSPQGHSLLRRRGISTYVDLHGDSAPGAGGLRYVSSPIRAAAQSPSSRRPTASDYAHYYCALLEECAGAFASSLAIVAGCARDGVVFGCLQGKDRTGLLAAALQEAVGVPLNQILRDFALSGRALAREIDQYAASWTKRSLSVSDYARRFELGAEPMAELMKRLGGPGTLLQRIARSAPPGIDMDEATRALRSLRAVP